MAILQRVRVAWSGFAGGPGVNTYYFTETATPTGALRTMYNSFAPVLPNSITISFPTTGDKIESTTGDLVGAWTAGPTTPVTGGAAAAPYSAASGLCIDWLTGSIVNGRRAMGRTFIVPIAGIHYGNTGAISTSIVTSAKGWADAVIASLGPNFVVWSRPFPGRAASAGPPPVEALPARPGTASPVVGANVPSKTVVLRSRRD